MPTVHRRFSSKRHHTRDTPKRVVQLARSTRDRIRFIKRFTKRDRHDLGLHTAFADRARRWRWSRRRCRSWCGARLRSRTRCWTRCRRRARLRSRSRSWTRCWSWCRIHSRTRIRSRTHNRIRNRSHRLIFNIIGAAGWNFPVQAIRQTLATDAEVNLNIDFMDSPVPPAPQNQTHVRDLSNSIRLDGDRVRAGVNLTERKLES